VAALQQKSTPLGVASSQLASVMLFNFKSSDAQSGDDRQEAEARAEVEVKEDHDSMTCS